MNYAECLNQLASLGHELRGVKFDLETIRRVLAALGDPHLKYPTAIVAGTNGKGSTCAMLASILERSRLRAGLYTSPHLVRVNERIRIAGCEISDEDFATAFSQVHQTANALIEEKELLRPPSYFEYLTATAFLHFARANADFVVLEVGMGGRLDATNIAEPLISVITNVALDHEQFLGNTVEAIAKEKAGVIKPNRPVISGCEHESAQEVIRLRAQELGSELIDLRHAARVSNVRDHEGWFSFDLALNGDCLMELAPSLRGKFQVKNAVAAVAAAQALQRQGFTIPTRAVEEGLRGVQWPGRLEVIHQHPLLLLDGAHNPAAAREVAMFVREELAGRRLRLVYGSMRDKAIDEISEALFPLANEVFLTCPPVARAASPAEIIRRACTQPERIVIEPDPARAVKDALEASADDDVILVAGSLFLVGEILKLQREILLSFERARGHAVSVSAS